MELIDIGETPFLEVLSYLDAAEIITVQGVCRSLRQNSALAWVQLEKTLKNDDNVDATTGQDATAQGRCCRYFKASAYAKEMQHVALQHYDYNDPEPTHVKCWCCRTFPNLEARVFRYPAKYEFFCRIANRTAHQECPKVLWQGFREANKVSYSGLSMDVSEILGKVKLQEDFGTYMFQSSDDEQNYVTMCDVTDSLMVTVVAVERAYPWRTCLVLATGGFHDCTTTTTSHDRGSKRCFRFHPRMVRSHGILRDEDYITAGFVTPTERLGEPLQECRLMLEHQW